MNLAEEVVRRARESPGRAAVTELEGRRSLSFAELLAAGQSVAGSLRAAGFTDGARVGVVLPNTLEWAVAVIGCWLADATPVLVNHSLPLDEIAGLLADVDAAAWFHEEGRHIDGLRSAAADIHGAVTLDDGPRPRPRPPGRACIIFTSGTEGKPKPAVLRHEGLGAATASIARALRGREGPYPIASPGTPPSFICLPLSHTGGLASFVFAFHVGRSVLVARRFTVEGTRRAVAEFGLDSLIVTPTMLHMLAEEEDLDLGTVKIVQSTGAPLASALQARFEQRFGVPVIQNYGQTETAHVAGWNREDLREGRWRPGSVGRPYEGVEVEIRDDDQVVLPAGEVGEIVVRSEHLMAGYEGRSDRLPGGWMATGDLGYLDRDGYLFVVDRKREVIICGGFNVYPAELESLVLEHPGVAGVAVIGVPDARLGEAPKAFVVPRQGASVTPAEIVEFTRSRTAHFKALREAELVDELPTLATEKVHRAGLRDQVEAAARATEPERPQG